MQLCLLCSTPHYYHIRSAILKLYRIYTTTLANKYTIISILYITWFIYICMYMCVCVCICIYIYYPLYTNWPITNSDLPHVIIQYILSFICQKLYWTVSGQLFNIGYIGQFQSEATDTLRTRYRRTKAVSMYLMKISTFLHLRKILIYFRIG